MSFHINFEDQGQDLVELTVDENTGLITEAGQFSYLYADGQHFVDVEQLYTNRFVHYFRLGGGAHWFKYPMSSLKLNDGVLFEAA